MGRTKEARDAIAFLETLTVPTGPLSGRPLRLAGYQKRFITGALGKGISIACLSVARGNAKTALSSGLALGHLIGAFGRKEPAREVLVAATNSEQAMIALRYVQALAASLPDDIQKQLIFRRAPRSQVEFTGDGGGHLLKAVPAVGTSILGASPTLSILDERAAWRDDSGQELEDAILTGALKRGGRTLMISTSAADDNHPFSKWLDEPQQGVYAQNHMPEPGLPADDIDSLKIANPGWKDGIGPKIDDLQEAARRAIARGGPALASFKNLSRNERVSTENRAMLIDAEDWERVETSDLPPRSGPVVVGIDLGGSSSMSAAAFFWVETGRLEAVGSFPASPNLAARGVKDGVGDRYVEMARRGELTTIGDRTVPIKTWIGDVLRLVEGQNIACITCDRFKASELGEALQSAGVRIPVVWRGQGWRDGAEDVERFRRWVYDERISTPESLLMRSALEHAVTLIDAAGNAKLAKGKSNARIDAAAAAILAVAEGSRILGRLEVNRGGRVLWA